MLSVMASLMAWPAWGQTPVAAYTITTPSTVSLDPQEPRVSIDVHDVTIKAALDQIATQAGIALSWSGTPHLSGRVTLALHDVPVRDAIAQVLKGSGAQARFSANGQTVVIGDTLHTNTEPYGIVSGRVTDSSTQKGIPGFTVTVAGTKLSVVTDQGGGFILRDVPIGEQQIVVKGFGYRPGMRSVKVSDGGHATVTIILVPVATVLSGVVTTATGVQSKMSVGSDITTINVDSVMRTAPINTVTDLLENRVPGLTVVHTSGTPGDPSRLRLRGASSLMESNNPIVVIDGVRAYYPDNENNAITNAEPASGTLVQTPRPSPLDQIDPNTIETIEVLKGPSASALYGSDAANGVIVITTKHGLPGQTRWTVSADQGVSYIPGDFPTLTYRLGERDNQEQGFQNCVGGVIPSGANLCFGDSVYAFQALNDPKFTPLTHGALSTASATVSGGVQALTYSFTGSYSDTHGMTKMPAASLQQYEQLVGATPPSWMTHPDDYTTWDVSSQLNVALGPTASVTVHNLLSSSTQHRSSLGLSAVSQLIGKVIDTTQLYTSTLLTGFMTQITQATQQTMTDGTLQWRVQPWLPLNVTAGLQQTNEADKTLEPAGLPSVLGADTAGQYAIGRGDATMVTLNATTTIPLTLPRGELIRLAMGTNLVSQSASDQSISTYSIPTGVNDPTTFDPSTTYAFQTAQSSATYGWFLEPRLSLGSRLYITPGIRLDGGTASGNGAGFTVFPKTNVSYLAIDHSSAASNFGSSAWTQVLTLLRLRGAFGIAGVQPTPGQSLRLYTPTTVTLDGGTVGSNANFLNTIGNTLLQPERSRELEAGFDAQLFQDRVTLTATYYNKVRFDAIQSIPVAPSVSGTGLPTSTTVNLGNIRNTGLEISATARLLSGQNIAWDINGDVSTNANRVLSVNTGVNGGCNDNIIPGTGLPDLYSCVRAGYPLDGVWIEPLVGFFDVNGDGIVEPNEIQLGDSTVYLGQQDPRYTASFGTTMTFWNSRLSLSMNGDYQNGLLQLNELAGFELASEANAPGATLVQQATAEAATNYNGYGAGAWSADYQTVNTLRLDALSVSVTLPSAIARAFHGHLATLSLQGSNLLLITNYKGKDPNVSAITSGENVADTGQLPLPRTWRLGVRVAQ